MIDVLLNGWSLVYEPDSPPALHLMTLISIRAPTVRYAIAVPSTPPEWLPQDIQIYEMQAANSEWGQLVWEQRILPGIAKRSHADLLHLTTPTPPLISSIPVVLSPSDYPKRRQRNGVIDRLRTALASGGMSRLSALFWPDDLVPLPDLSVRFCSLPPIVLGGFFAAEDARDNLPAGIELPESYVLYQGPVDRATISRLLDVWTWADGPIGEYYPLLVVGLKHSVMEEVRSRIDANTSVQALPSINPLILTHIYQRSTAVINLGDIPAWGNAARNAIACAKPFVASYSMEIESIVGPAAYLVPEGNSRMLGAALITVVVEDLLAEQLSKAAQERSSAWDVSRFSAALGDAYDNVSMC